MAHAQHTNETPMREMFNKFVKHLISMDVFGHCELLYAFYEHCHEHQVKPMPTIATMHIAHTPYQKSNK